MSLSQSGRRVGEVLFQVPGMVFEGLPIDLPAATCLPNFSFKSSEKDPNLAKMLRSGKIYNRS